MMRFNEETYALELQTDHGDVKCYALQHAHVINSCYTKKNTLPFQWQSKKAFLLWSSYIRSNLFSRKENTVSAKCMAKPKWYLIPLFFLSGIISLVEHVFYKKKTTTSI